MGQLYSMEEVQFGATVALEEEEDEDQLNEHPVAPATLQYKLHEDHYSASSEPSVESMKSQSQQQQSSTAPVTGVEGPEQARPLVLLPLSNSPLSGTVTLTTLQSMEEKHVDDLWAESRELSEFIKRNAGYRPYRMPVQVPLHSKCKQQSFVHGAARRQDVHVIWVAYSPTPPTYNGVPLPAIRLCNRTSKRCPALCMWCGNASHLISPELSSISSQLSSNVALVKTCDDKQTEWVCVFCNQECMDAFRHKETNASHQADDGWLCGMVEYSINM